MLKRGKFWIVLVSLGLLLLADSCSTGIGTIDSPQVPVIYCTDLFHPYDDPDDHFDIAALYALEELDIQGIVLDQGKKQDLKPGRIPVEQINYMTGRDVPYAIGLSEPLGSTDDKALDEPDRYQNGVRMILDILEGSQDPVTIITVGSLRDVVAAFNRRPDLFRERVSRLIIFIGEASAGTREWNVDLDPNAFIRIMNSGLPVWWIPCFDGGNFKNRGNASFWKAPHADLFKYASDQVMNFFIYALLKKDLPDYLGFLEDEVDERDRDQVISEVRNLWCAAVFTEAAGRKIIKKDAGWASVPGCYPSEETQVCEVFRFVPIDVYVDNKARVVYQDKDRSHQIFRFQIINLESYPEIMTSVTSHLIGDIKKRNGTEPGVY
ncbi:MAG: nucleoside hydrolase [Candidatus Aminicenantes bacterium]|nr:nucleoside hydrolase [Candidatus Aminicenantes bacterium]